MTELQRTDDRPERPVQTATTARTRPVLTALRSMDGRATLGDVVAATGMVRDEAEAALRELLEERRGHLEVGAEGTLVYRFDERFIRRGQEPWWVTLREGAWSAFKVGFKIWTAAMLVVYFVLFLVLLVAAVLKSDSDDIDLGGGGHRGHRGGGFPSFWFWYLIWSPDWYWGRPYYGERWEKRQKVRVPFWKKVFAFVFGPDRPKPTQRQKDRSVIRLIRARRGALTSAELVEHTGLRRHEADEEMGRLMVTLDGDARVSPDGEVVYVFPELMVSAHGEVKERDPAPAWRRLEPKQSLTGNSKGTDAIIAGINGFNLIAAATAPLFIFPRLGFSGTAAWIVLVWIPVVFSTMFYGIPLARWFANAKENARRAGRNLRKVLLGWVYRASLVGDGAQPVRPTELGPKVAETLKKEKKAPKVEPADVEEELLRLTAEFDGEVTATDDGGAEYRFPRIREAYLAARRMRDELRLEEAEVGPIVYDSEDTVEEQGRRDLEAFDRAIEEEQPGRTSAGLGAGEGEAAVGEDESALGGDERFLAQLPPPDRVAFEDDFDLVAFEEEMKRRGKKEKVRVGSRR